MKTKLFIVILSFLLAGSSGCDKSTAELEKATFHVKVIDEICGNAVVQIQDSTLYQYGVNGYVKADSTYDHVFTTRFSCADMAKLQTFTADKSGIVIKVKLIKDAPQEQACIRCAATLANPPAIFHLIAFTTDWSY